MIKLQLQSYHLPWYVNQKKDKRLKNNLSKLNAIFKKYFTQALALFFNVVHCLDLVYNQKEILPLEGEGLQKPNEIIGKHACNWH